MKLKVKKKVKKKVKLSKMLDSQRSLYLVPEYNLIFKAGMVT